MGSPGERGSPGPAGERGPTGSQGVQGVPGPPVSGDRGIGIGIRIVTEIRILSGILSR